MTALEIIKHQSLTWKPYICTTCGHQQQISTNHTMKCYDYCKNCSWKMIWKSKDYIHYGKHIYRAFILATVNENA